jgi:hypothetical protein
MSSGPFETVAGGADCGCVRNVGDDPDGRIRANSDSTGRKVDVAGASRRARLAAVPKNKAARMELLTSARRGLEGVDAGCLMAA